MLDGTDNLRPSFPKRAVVTAGMPYGNKELHFGHVGGVFVHADMLARFLRDRIGKENVLFVSGTDCYGSPIVETHRQMVAEGLFSGSIDDFVLHNHERQAATMKKYHIDLNLFAASGIGRQGEIHGEMGALFLESLYANGHLEKLATRQFYDAERETFLNGRQVLGTCPVEGCRSEKAYADECSLGHQYEPKDLINPKSALTGEMPEMREVANWYLKLPGFKPLLETWVQNLGGDIRWRDFVIRTIQEYFEPPIIHVTRDQIESLEQVVSSLPRHVQQEGRGNSVQLVFENLEDLELGRSRLGERGIRYRVGKTLVPFRLTGNLGWGVKAPVVEDLEGLTFWVWPESLWAPISFTSAYLEEIGAGRDAWKTWWCSKDAEVYQFIGEDNVFFYSLPEMSMFMGMQGKGPVADPPEGQLQLPHLIANRHVLFLDKKASSSGDIKPPIADDLLAFYMPEQLRIHFLSLGLSRRTTSFRPKPLNPAANDKEGDPVLKDGLLLVNTFNRAIRSCFYTAQKFYEGRIPLGEISAEVVEASRHVILEFEAAMHQHDFPLAINKVGAYVRSINQMWSQTKPFNDSCDPDIRVRALKDAFHMVRVATVLLHPVAPEGTDTVRRYLGADDTFWDWDRIFEPVYSFFENPDTHTLKFLEPRTDFFAKHPSQFSEE
ncbi:MAG: class I tRNA ligase family protein [bacterium]|nr:class I tRNA ligase family protein [bacterium]